MKNENPNPPPTKDERDTPRKTSGKEDFKSDVNLPGKTDSGPEPEVHGRVIPPQK